MRRTLLHSWLMLILITLSGCEDMFIREINLEAEKEQEMLVLSCPLSLGNTPRVLVFHSFFFGHQPTGTSKGEVTDASVSMRINHGEWMRLQNTNTNSNVYNKLNDSTYAPHIEALDTVEVMVSHPDYPSVATREIMPAYVKGRVVSWAMQPNFWMDITLELEPYQGNADDVLAFAFTEGLFVLSRASIANDAGIQDSIPVNGIYSTDAIFAESLNLSVAGYYGAPSNQPLFFPASELQQTRQIHLMVDGQWEGMNKKYYTKAEPAGFYLEMRAYTRSGYLTVQSDRLLGGAPYLAPPSGLEASEGNVIQQLIAAIKEALGQQEPARAYTNVEGGLGQMTGVSRRAFVFGGVKPAVPVY